MKKYKIFIILFVIFSVNNVKAKCDTNLNISLANNIAYSYKYNGTANGTTNGITFDLTFTNLNNMFYIVDQDNNYHGGFGEATVYGLLPNKTYTYRIYSSILDCDNNVIRTINIKTPPYNYYYATDVCQDIKDFKYCKRWSKNNLEMFEMFDKVSEYTKSKEKVEINEAVYKKTISDKIVDIIKYLYTNYYYIILPAIIIVSIYIIYRLDKKDSLF